MSHGVPDKRRRRDDEEHGRGAGDATHDDELWKT